MAEIERRKQDHLDLCIRGDVGYRKSSGFERYDFVHNALPELNVEDISLKTKFLGREFGAPLMISSMTGGMEKGIEINRMLAAAASRYNLPMGVGSQRAMIEHPETAGTFLAARKMAPDLFLAANIGGVQLVDNSYVAKTVEAAAALEANAIIVHLNPLQELLQPGGDRNFKGVLDGIARLCDSSKLPVIVKETGAGISKNAAARLLSVGVQGIDVAGAGGTSWSAVEQMRSESNPAESAFLREWGIPTATCIRQIAELKGPYRFALLGSGGVYGAPEILKSLALGADFTAMARPLVQQLASGGAHQLENWLDSLFYALKNALLLLGVPSPAQLNRQHIMDFQ